MAFSFRTVSLSLLPTLYHLIPSLTQKVNSVSIFLMLFTSWGVQ